MVWSFYVAFAVAAAGAALVGYHPLEGSYPVGMQRDALRRCSVNPYKITRAVTINEENTKRNVFGHL